MLCYKDTTFCTSPCAAECDIKLTDEVKEAAVKWWGKEGAPVAEADFKCERFEREPNDNQETMMISSEEDQL